MYDTVVKKVKILLKLKLAKNIFSFFAFFALFYPLFFVNAWAPGDQPTNFTEFVINFIDVLTTVTIFIAGFGFFGMVVGIMKYSGAGGDEERLGKAKQLISYGLLGMLIIFSFWGLAQLIARTYLGV